MIKVTDIHKRFGDLEVLKGVSLDVARGEVVSIVGASGAGKTTLLQIVGTLSRPDGGRVEIDGQDVFSLGDKTLSRFRNGRIGFVFQFHHLLPEFTAFENVCIPGLIGKHPRAEVERRAAELLRKRKSRRAILDDLHAKGIDRGVAAEAVEALFAQSEEDEEENPELANARALVERHYAAKLAQGKWQQVAAALARRGFSHSVIRQALADAETEETEA